MKTAMKKPKARLVSLGIRLTPAEKAAIEIWAEREERAPSVVVRRLVIANLKAEALMIDGDLDALIAKMGDARRRETTHWAQTMLANPDVRSVPAGDAFPHGAPGGRQFSPNFARDAETRRARAQQPIGEASL